MSGSLMKRTQDLVLNREEYLEDIAAATGVSVPWLSKLAKGRHKRGADVDLVQRVYEYLTGSKLDIR